MTIIEQKTLEIVCSNLPLIAEQLERIAEILSNKEDDSKKNTCSICHKEFGGYGNNAWPLADGVCCDECNKLVIARRMLMAKKGD